MRLFTALIVAVSTLAPCVSLDVLAWTLQPPAPIELPRDVELIALPTPEAPTTEPQPTQARVASYAAREYFGYVFAETNPSSGRRELFLSKSGVFRHNVVANLAFAETDESTYQRCVGCLNKLVVVYGVPVDRGGMTWVLVQDVNRLP